VTNPNGMPDDDEPPVSVAVVGSDQEMVNEVVRFMLRRTADHCQTHFDDMADHLAKMPSEFVAGYAAAVIDMTRMIRHSATARTFPVKVMRNE
jgi:hypothetical protein